MIKEALNMKSDNPKLNRLLQVYIKSGFSVKEIKGGYQVEDKHSITKIFIEEKKRERTIQNCSSIQERQKQETKRVSSLQSKINSGGYNGISWFCN